MGAKARKMAKGGGGKRVIIRGWRVADIEKRAQARKALFEKDGARILSKTTRILRERAERDFATLLTADED